MYNEKSKHAHMIQKSDKRRKKISEFVDFMELEFYSPACILVIK